MQKDSREETLGVGRQEDILGRQGTKKPERYVSQGRGGSQGRHVGTGETWESWET